MLRFVLVMLACGLIINEGSAFGKRRYRSNYNSHYSSFYYHQKSTVQSLQVLQDTQFQHFEFKQYSQSVEQTSNFQNLLALHNQVRAQSGLAPLTLDPQLCHEAQQSALAQAQRGQCGHFLSLSGGSENSAQGQISEMEVHSSWMASSGHRANIVNRQWSRVGFGLSYGPRGPYWAARYR